MKTKDRRVVVDYDYITRSHVSDIAVHEYHRGIVNPPVLEALSRKQDDDHKTCLVDTLDRHELVEHFLNSNSSTFNQQHPILKEFEEAEVNKVGPFSPRLSADERSVQILEYFKEQSSFSPDPEMFTQAVLNVIDKFGGNKLSRLRPYSLDQVYETSDKSTNWGAPYWSSGKTSGLAHLDLAYEIYDLRLVPKDVCGLGWRGQPSGDNLPKQRTVWMYPHALILVELTFMQPLLKHLKEFEEFSMWRSIEDVSVPISGMLQRARKDRWPILGFDASAFDANCGQEIIYAAFFVIKSFFQVSFHDVIDLICIYFCTSKLQVWRGEVYTGRKGSVPSGSAFTNLCDCVIHLIMFEYCCIATSCYSGSVVVQGDDGVWYLPYVSLDDIVKHVSDCGHTMVKSKQSWSTEYVTFCQRIFIADLMNSEGIANGIRSVVRTLNGMMSYEREPKSGTPDSFESCRFITQLEDAKYNPMYVNLIRFTIEYDKFGLGIDLPGGPMSMFKGIGFQEFMTLRGKGFQYTSFVRKEEDLLKLQTVKVINSLKDAG